MSDSTTVTVRLPTAVKNDLDLLAAHTKRSKSFLAGAAIASFVSRELAIVEAIERGIEDVRAGRIVPHKEAMRQLRARIAAAGTKAS